MKITTTQHNVLAILTAGGRVVTSPGGRRYRRGALRRADCYRADGRWFGRIDLRTLDGLVSAGCVRIAREHSGHGVNIYIAK
jgi:uncharacterized protein YjhX (UPF0386 family)